MLHIANGDSTATLLQASGLQGDSLPWREALCVGPTPAVSDRDEWLRLRARFLADEYDVDFDGCLAELTRQEEAIDAVGTHDEVILWFEFDLFCQINLIYLLDRIDAIDPPRTKVCLVSIDSFPGIENFGGLGELSPSDLATLFEKRIALTDRELALAARAWEAYRSADPTAVESLLAGDTSALPYLHAALIRHLARFPSTSNGLGAIEQMALTLVDSGVQEFTKLFKEIFALAPGYGYGDFQVWSELTRMARCEHPLVTIERLSDDTHPLHSGAFRHASFLLTEDGRSVLSNSADAVHRNGIDRWIGGVHLESGGTMWRWNRDLERLLRIQN